MTEQGQTLNRSASLPEWIDVVPVLSTAHIIRHCDEWLQQYRAAAPTNSNIAAYSGGYFIKVVWTSGDDEADTGLGIPPDCLRAVRKWALDNGYHWFRLDALGVEVEGLPVYDWEAPAETNEVEDPILTRILDTMTEQYLATMLWAETHEDDQGITRNLDDNLDIADIADEAKAQARSDCKDFLLANLDTLSKSGLGAGSIGHNFWLNRNGHGAGFWDMNLGEIGDKLDQAAMVYGGVFTYVGDDGKIYTH